MFLNEKRMKMQLSVNKKVHYLILFLVLFLMVIPHSNAQSGELNDFKVKGFYLDFRIEVMTPEALRDFAKELAGFGMNTLIVEWTASYPYKNNATITGRYAYTRQEIKSFVNYCHQLGIQVIPSQECFGHVQYILRHNRYANLRVSNQDVSQVCACKTLEDSSLFSDLFSDMASLFPSKYVFIGGDETRSLGLCKECEEKIKKEGKAKVYADYMKMMCDIVLRLGKIPVMWDDMILKYPEDAQEIPKQTILVDWNYGWKINHFGDIGNLQRMGFTFWGAPAIRSHPDDWFVTDWKKHFENQRDFIPYARSAKYQGMVMTSWSTSGLYGFTWGVGNQVIDMEQIRNTYPQSGFRILIASYARALSQQDPINPASFVIEYAQKRFGLTKEGGSLLWKALTISPELIVEGKPAGNQSIQEMRNENNVARQILYQLKPERNQKEFDHFRLMADLRDYYLAYKEIEAAYNSPAFNDKISLQLINELNDLKKRAVKLDERFYRLNKGFLFDGEIREQNNIRNKPVDLLYLRLSGAK